jgi:hypothetical protein
MLRLWQLVPTHPTPCCNNVHLVWFWSVLVEIILPWVVILPLEDVAVLLGLVEHFDSF